MSTVITDLGYFRVQDERQCGTEFKFRDGELWISIEGSGYDGDHGSVSSISVPDAHALLNYLQGAIPAC